MATEKASIIVTGANGGLGSAIAKRLSQDAALSGYRGIYMVRDATAAPALRTVLAGSPLHRHDVMSVDLTRRDSVRQIAETINTRVAEGLEPPIQAIILNAGFQDFGKQTWSDEGLDTTFIANYLGHWLLTLLLLKSMDKKTGRIIVVGSQSHDPYDKRNDSSKAFVDAKYKTFINDDSSFEAIARGTWSPARDDPSFRSGFRRYGAAKLFLIMMIHELQHRLNKDPNLHNICVLGVDPGTMITGLQRHAPWIIRVLIFKVIYPIIAFLMPNGPVRSTDKSASHILQAALESTPGLGQYPKDLYFNGTLSWETSAESKDIQKRDLVWRESIRLAGLREGETALVHWRSNNDAGKVRL